MNYACSIHDFTERNQEGEKFYEIKAHVNLMAHFEEGFETV